MFLIPKIRLLYRKYVPYRIVRSKDYRELLLQLSENNRHIIDQALEQNSLLFKLIDAREQNQQLTEELRATRKIAHLFSN